MREIAVVIPKYGLVGGAEQFASELTEKIAIGGRNSFYVFANQWQSGSSTVRFHKIPIISFPKFMTTISFAWFAGRRIQQNNFSLVHSHERIFSADLFTLHGIPHRYWVHSVRCKRMSLYDLATAWVEKKACSRGELPQVYRRFRADQGYLYAGIPRSSRQRQGDSSRREFVRLQTKKQE